MILFIYGTIGSLGILGLSVYFFPQYQSELFFGWFGPVVSGAVTIYFVQRESKKGLSLITKTLVIGFAIKMVFYGAYILILFKFYSFTPIPLMCSFASFFLGLHALEAVIIKRISQSFKIKT